MELYQAQGGRTEAKKCRQKIMQKWEYEMKIGEGVEVEIRRHCIKQVMIDEDRWKYSLK